MEGWVATRLKTAQVLWPRARAREIVLLMEGAMVLMVIHRDRRYIDAAAHAAQQLVAGKWSEGRSRVKVRAS
jgi:hypothetical protein